MNLKFEDKNGVKIASLEGKLDSNASGDIYDDMVGLAQENEKIVINLSNLEYISSAGLRILLLVAKLNRSRHRMGAVLICNPNEFVREVLDISGFHSLIHIFESEQEALENL